MDTRSKWNGGQIGQPRHSSQKKPQARGNWADKAVLLVIRATQKGLGSVGYRPSPYTHKGRRVVAVSGRTRGSIRNSIYPKARKWIFSGNNGRGHWCKSSGIVLFVLVAIPDPREAQTDRQADRQTDMQTCRQMRAISRAIAANQPSAALDASCSHMWL
ncbi:hypothetical protein H4219_006272 [Mycoemilia scoparia]|uniref:Uncharacterized protein n=1 Tax=Mycoemilia scoparia TaxID=417184 RepID=A0A9W7ZIT4_9FUNG|nr:hypothetical protein H4219_006272 [Mycoemilia scoparia]